MSKEARMLAEFRNHDNVKNCVVHHILAKIKTGNLVEINKEAQPALYCICAACMFQFQKKNIRRYVITIDALFLHTAHRAAELGRFTANAKHSIWQEWRKASGKAFSPFRLDHHTVTGTRGLSAPIKNLDWTSGAAMVDKGLDKGAVAKGITAVHGIVNHTGTRHGSIPDSFKRNDRIQYDDEINRAWAVRAKYERSSRLGRVLQRGRPKKAIFDKFLMGRRFKQHILAAVTEWNDAGRPSAKKSWAATNFTIKNKYHLDLLDVLTFYRGITPKKWGPDSLFQPQEIGLNNSAVAPISMQR